MMTFSGSLRGRRRKVWKWGLMKTASPRLWCIQKSESFVMVEAWRRDSLILWLTRGELVRSDLACLVRLSKRMGFWWEEGLVLWVGRNMEMQGPEAVIKSRRLSEVSLSIVGSITELMGEVKGE